ncbi:MAG: class I SAM-dependent methyltransferase [Planctomycetota bacterium]|nr:MAG: class I SAM-dependent methyltransferase [Planctomycetota bacterium]
MQLTREQPTASSSEGPTPSRIDPAPSEGRQRYFVHLRTDVLALVPESAVSVLSVGCGSGRTEAELVRRGCRVTGIEMDRDAAAAASEQGLEMLTGDVNEIGARLADRQFDCLLYADVLEHIADPVAVLREHVSKLNPGGCVIISVPNFRHLSVLSALFLRGHVRYVDSGIFDRTHLRLTTRKMVEEWFGEVGLRTDAVDYRLWRRRGEALSMLTLGLFKEFLAYQVILRGVKPGGEL